MRLSAVASENKNASGQGDDAQDRWKRNGLVFFPGSLDGTDVHDFLVGGIADALIHQCDHAQCDQGQTEAITPSAIKARPSSEVPFIAGPPFRFLDHSAPTALRPASRAHCRRATWPSKVIRNSTTNR